MKKLLTFSFLLVSVTSFFFATLFTSCARKVLVTCGTADLMNRPSVESKVLSLKTVGIVDTTIAFVSGFVTGKDSTDKKITIDTLAFTSIQFVNLVSSDSVVVFADDKGKFQQHLIAGTYTILMCYVGYNRLSIENVSFGTGELKELNVILGRGFNTTKINAQRQR